MHVFHLYLLFCQSLFLIAAMCTHFPKKLMADYSYLYCFLTGPNASPTNVSGRAINSTSILVSWGEVPFPDQNGVILSYTVTYRWQPSGPAQTQNVTAPASQTTLTDLNEYTNYRITVFASTSKGEGNKSTPFVVITDEDSEFRFHFMMKS